MLYKFILDENNYLIGLMHTGTEEDIYELEPTTIKLNYLNCYKLVDDEIIFDEEKYNSLVDTKAKAEQIAELKNQLADTDYQAIKYSEGWFTEEEYAPIKAKRENLREQIRALESEIINGEL